MMTDLPNMDDDREALESLADELFGTHSNIPPTFVRQLKRHVDTATAKLGLVVDSETNQRVAYWIDGRSLGVLGCSGRDDSDLGNFGGSIRQLDHVTAVDLEVVVHYSDAAYAGRRLTIGPKDEPDIVLDASPGQFPPEKRVQIEQFIDQLLTALAGRTFGQR
jgi:hypothetical protein